MIMSLRLGSSAVALFALLTTLGCASERPPINRVQANALEKSFFVGEIDNTSDDPEFYWRNFVVDGSESQSMVGIGSWSGVDRIRWEISENMLFARRAYQQNPGADDKGTRDKTDGTIVAAYPIESHFDIRREYNPSTGEELNVIGENTSDRPWHDREFMRVDWSVNLVETPLWMDMFAGKVFGDISVTPLAYYVGDASAEDAPHFVPEEGYFDVTSKFWIEPQSVDFGGEQLPVCLMIGLFTGNATDNCDPQEAVIRSSYLKVANVDQDGDFEPFENSRAPLDIVGNPGGLGDSFSVGIVTPPRIEWDPQYGYTDANLQRFMHVHNIWKQSHQTEGSCNSDSDCSQGSCLPSGTCSISCNFNARADGNANGTDDQCENDDTGYSGSEGSQCSYRSRCTIPYRDREIRPIGFWMNKETPDALTDEVDEEGNFVKRGATEDLAYTWNQALKQSVAKAREVECRRTGGDRADCHAEFFEPGGIEMVSMGGWGIEQVKDMPDVLVACHNPVRAYDHEICGAEGYSARVGDLRHNFLFYWPYSSKAPWGGIANWNADPLTGQIIGASATTMGRSTTFSAAMVRDIIMVANGERSISDIAGGATAFLYEKELREGRLPKTFTKEELEARVASINPENALETLGSPGVPLPDNGNPMQALMEQKLDTIVSYGVSGGSQLEFEAVADRIRGSQAEAQLIDPNWLFDTAGLPPTAEMSDAIMDVVSPLRGNDNFDFGQFQRLMDLRFQARGICFTDPEASNVGNEDVQGVAAYFLQKYSDEKLAERFDVDVDDPPSNSYFADRRAELIYEDLWKETYKGIQLHEMGHALGLLHQFTSSYDSTNYNPQYWQLRTQEGRAMQSCDGDPRTGTPAELFDATHDTCMGPRYLDPETDDELGRRVEGAGANAKAVEPRPGINYFAHTSTMEYQNERFFESVGLGQYDLHAMNALYGRVLQTFDADAEDSLPQEDQAMFMGRLYSQLVDDHLLSVAADPTRPHATGFETVHYTEAARLMKLYDGDRCREASSREKELAEWRVVHDKVCMPPSKDYAAWDDFVNRPTAINGQLMNVSAPHAQVRHGLPGGGNFRWPYRWGVGTNSYPHANSVDAGADMYELTRETIKKFDYSYIYNYFRRARRDWYYGGVPARTSGAFFERLRAYHWGIASYNAFLRSFGNDVYNGVATSDDRWRPYLIAETEMFNAIARAIVMPQIGPYYKAQNFQQNDGTRDLYDPDGTVEDPDTGAISLGDPGNFTIDASTGRYIDPAFDWGPDFGGSWDYQNWIGWIGFGAEKVDALRTLVDGRSVFSFVSRSNYLDGRNLNVNFRSDMGRAVDRLLGGLLARDWEAIAPYVERGIANPAVELMDLNAEMPTRPPAGDAHLLFPNVSYRQQLGAIVWGHLFSRLNTDLSLSNKLRIYVDGFQSQIEIPEEQQIRFYNPESGFTYIARRYGLEEVDGRMIDKGIASRMLQRANLLLIDAYEVVTDENGEVVYDNFGMPEVVRDAEGFEVRRAEFEEIAFNTLRNYVGLIDMAVQVNDLVGYGPVPD